MFIACLIAPPGKLDAALAESLRNAWGGGGVNWLSAGEAAEFPLAMVPENFESVWVDLQKLGVDLAVVPAKGRIKRVLIADMDSTMIQQECIDELADVAGVGDEVKEITARAMNGELDFEGSVKARVGLMNGLAAGVIDQVLHERITHMPGAATLVATMKAHGAYTALVSGGFTMFTAAVAEALGFDENRANTLIVESGALTGAVAEPILGRDAKVTALEQIAAQEGVTDAEVLAVGDGANDLGMLGRAGLGVAVHAKPAVAAACKVRINHCDLTALLFLQGLQKNEFSAT